MLTFSALRVTVVARTCLLFCAIMLVFWNTSALAVPVVPANDGYVTDAAKLLTTEQEQAMEAVLSTYASQTSTDIAVLTIPGLEGYSLEEYSLDVARGWKLGSVGKNNGLLIVIAYDDHLIRFEVGKGLEGAVPDIVAKGIQEEDMVPLFRAGDYNGGIVAAIDALQKHIGGEYTADRYTAKSESSGIGVYGFFAFLVFLQWVAAILGRSKSWWLGGVLGGVGGLMIALVFGSGWWLLIAPLIAAGLLLDFLVSKNYASRGATSWWAGGGWGPGGGGSSRGGGFGGFGGGGGFSGGGSSSRW